MKYSPLSAKTSQWLRNDVVNIFAATSQTRSRSCTPTPVAFVEANGGCGCMYGYMEVYEINPNPDYICLSFVMNFPPFMKTFLIIKSVQLKLHLNIDSSRNSKFDRCRGRILNFEFRYTFKNDSSQSSKSTAVAVEFWISNFGINFKNGISQISNFDRCRGRILNLGFWY